MYFDNLSVTHYTGPLTEETHYYPFGLTMAGVSSKAVGRIENKYKFNGIEQNTDLDLNMYDAFYRNLDPQIGRWWQIDPLIELNMENWSPYLSNLDNPITYDDPRGDCPMCVPIIIWIAEAAGVTAEVAVTATATVAASKATADLIRNPPSAAGTNTVTNNSFAWDPTYVDKYLRSNNTTSANITEHTNNPAKTIDGGILVMPKDVVKTEAGSPDKASGKRRNNWLPDKGEPNSTQTNKPGTTTKKYGPDGNVQKEYNQAHPGNKVPKNERSDHVHDYKPDPNNPSGRGERMPGRPPKKNELLKDFNIKKDK